MLLLLVVEIHFISEGFFSQAKQVKHCHVESYSRPVCQIFRGCVSCRSFGIATIATDDFDLRRD